MCSSDLWGFLADTFRFLPYVGAIAAAGLPISMAIIQFPDWTHPALVAGLFIVVELATNALVEPLTYGKSAGVSTVALLVAATFWTWIWGPLGLLLSVPLTVALAVLGKYVPQFELLGILLGDGPALDPHVSFYQRLLAGDTDEAAAMIEEQLATRKRAGVYDDFVIPALVLAERDRQSWYETRRHSVLCYPPVYPLVSQGNAGVHWSEEGKIFRLLFLDRKSRRLERSFYDGNGGA